MRGGPRVSRYQIRAALIFISQPKMRLLTPCCHNHLDMMRELVGACTGLTCFQSNHLLAGMLVPHTAL